MKLKTKRDRDLFEMQNPKANKFTKTDLAKFINASEMRPYDVSWGAEVNMTKFQVIMEKEWDKSNLKYNEEFYKELIAKAILFKEIETYNQKLEEQKNQSLQDLAYNQLNEVVNFATKTTYDLSQNQIRKIINTEVNYD